MAITPRQKLRLPSSTRPPAASRCRHVPSAQQHYDAPAKERPSAPYLGEGEAWKSPSRGRLACPPPLFLRRCPPFCFRFPTKLCEEVDKKCCTTNELFPSKIVCPPHSPPLNLTYFPDYVRNLDEVPSIQCDFFGIGMTCNDPIHCSHRCFQVVEFYRFLNVWKFLFFFFFKERR